jgi:hypothetical protein
MIVATWNARLCPFDGPARGPGGRTVDDTKRAKWIAVLVLVVAGGLFGRSMAHQIADEQQADPIRANASETLSTGGLYALHTQCAQHCRQRGDVSGALWHERILAHIRGEYVDESANLDDAGEAWRQNGSQPPSSKQSLEDPTHPRHASAEADAGGLLAH